MQSALTSPIQTFAFAAGQTSFQQMHVYRDDNPSGTPADQYTVTYTLRDDDAAATTQSHSVTVENRPPWSDLAVNSGPIEFFNVFENEPINEGEYAYIEGSIGDSSPDDSFWFTWDWGDGPNPGGMNGYTYPAGTTSIDWSHRYLDDNDTPSDQYTFTYSLTDDDGGTSSGTKSITVKNVAPQLTQGGLIFRTHHKLRGVKCMSSQLTGFHFRVLRPIAVAVVLNQALMTAQSNAASVDFGLIKDAQLIVAGRLKYGSLKQVQHVPQGRKPSPFDVSATVPWEHHATLIVTEVLKGKLEHKELPIIIHYDVEARVEGRRLDGSKSPCRIMQLTLTPQWHDVAGSGCAF